MTISDVIRELRESRVASRPDLARRSKVSRPHLWHIERGHMTLSLLTLAKISDALNVGMNRFFTESDIELLLEEPFIQELLPFLRHLNLQNRKHILKTMQAAPRSRWAA